MLVVDFLLTRRKACRSVVGSLPSVDVGLEGATSSLKTGSNSALESSSKRRKSTVCKVDPSPSCPSSSDATVWTADCTISLKACWQRWFSVLSEE